MDSAQIREEVAKLAPWITGFYLGDEKYGGDYVPDHDERFGLFLDVARKRLPPQNMRILECGCLEGGHTHLLGKAFPSGRITAVDVREENLTKARLLTRLKDIANCDFVLDDLDDPRLVFEHAYDAVFCVGLLYHLRWPGVFLHRCARAAPLLWLWTVFCSEEEAMVKESGGRGRIYHEPIQHPLSGVRAESFFPTLGSLVESLWSAGYTRVNLVKKEMTLNGNGPAILLCATTDNAWAIGKAHRDMDVTTES